MSTDRDNYRAGMLKYKKLAEENPDDESLGEERIKNMIKEEMINSEIFKEQSEKQFILDTVIKENKELKVAAANKSQISNLSGASSSPDITTEEITPEQKAYFEKVSKEIGYKIDPKVFLENYKKSLQK